MHATRDSTMTHCSGGELSWVSTGWHHQIILILMQRKLKSKIIIIS